ncbi:Vanillate monooxygenase [Sphingomonas paucimobilis]|nr:Vanillate monooxygenase [Sphingomonas paucimobilis]
MFLKNAWYMAGWSETLTEKPQGIRMLGEKIALFRLENGEVAAIGDRCPHRFASLSGGVLVHDTLQCPYHGLRFDRSGACVHNPHHGGIIPPGAVTRSYPVEERHHGIWVWMGAPEAADPALIPDLSMLDAPELVGTRGCLHVPADYRLVIDNLMDLTHVNYLHPLLGIEDAAANTRVSVEQEGRDVWSYMWTDGSELPLLFQMLWRGPKGNAKMRGHMRWTAPAALLLDSGATEIGGNPDASIFLPTAHLLTPETETSTHYFWTQYRDVLTDDAELTQQIHAGVAHTFATEDEPMIAQVAANMDGQDFWDLRPAILNTDAGAVRARRLLAKLIREEEAAVAKEPEGAGRPVESALPA